MNDDCLLEYKADLASLVCKLISAAILTIGSFLPNKIFGKIPFGRKLDVNVKIMGDALGESKNVLMINVIGKSFTAREKTTRLLVDCISKVGK